MDFTYRLMPSFACLFDLILYVPSTILQLCRDGSSRVKPVLSLAKGPQRSDAGEARNRDPLVSCQTLYHWAHAPPNAIVLVNVCLYIFLI